MKRAICVSVFILLGCFLTFATIQIPDKLFYGGKEYTMNNFYLENYFNDNPGTKPNFEISITALWRGYVATFEIENDKLYLTGVEILDFEEDGRLKWKSVMNDIFPGSGKVKAEWFTGILWGGFNNKERLDPFEFDNYSIFEIDKGNIVKKKGLTKREYKKFKKQQIEAFKKTDEYHECIEKLKEENLKQIEELKQFDKEIGNQQTEKTYNSYIFSDKKAKEYIEHHIFSFTPKFLE